MSGSSADLSELLTYVTKAVVSTQRGLDTFVTQTATDLPLPPLAFIVQETQLTLVGNLSPQQLDSPERKGALTFGLIDRVQETLRGATGMARASRISVSIGAVAPPHGDQKAAGL